MSIDFRGIAGWGAGAWEFDLSALRSLITKPGSAAAAAAVHAGVFIHLSNDRGARVADQ